MLRRGGTHGPAHDLNAELTVPLALHIASSWRDLFSANLFGKLEHDVAQAIDDVVDEFVQGVPEYLKSRAQEQADSCRQEARSALSTIMTIVGCELNAQQKTISRGIAPHVQSILLPAYDDAILETGPGSVARQQVSRPHLASAQRYTTAERAMRIETRPRLRARETRVSLRGHRRRPHETARCRRGRDRTLFEGCPAEDRSKGELR